MAWQMLPTNYTDAVWNGLKRYVEISNEDGTVSFQDVTQYSNRENSFFGAKEANRMNEALNTIMSMLENGGDLYADFQNYFTLQKAEFTEYTNEVKSEYRNEIAAFEQAQAQAFTTWFDFVKGQLSGDVAGNLQNRIEESAERIAMLENMVLMNDYCAPIATNDSELTILVDDLGNSILADWKYSEVK